MKIIVGGKSHKLPGIVSKNPFSGRSGCWGIVRSADSRGNAVDVYTDMGIFVNHVPVASFEWVANYDGYTSGSRNLPPEGARVFIMMPTGTMDGAFVLCSAPTVLDQKHREAFMQEGRETERLQVLPGGWRKTYDYTTGNYSISSSDGTVAFSVEMEGNIDLSAFENLSVRLTKESCVFEVFGAGYEIANDGKIKINGGGAAAARRGDKVKVTIPANSFIVSVSGQATGVPNAGPVEVEGTIEAGSETVEIG
jgi:hypothetical protein